MGTALHQLKKLKKQHTVNPAKLSLDLMDVQLRLFSESGTGLCQFLPQADPSADKRLFIGADQATTEMKAVNILKMLTNTGSSWDPVHRLDNDAEGAVNDANMEGSFHWPASILQTGLSERENKSRKLASLRGLRL
jgi:hypothetical protein